MLKRPARLGKSFVISNTKYNPNTLVLSPDYFTVYAGHERIIPIASILVNDTDLGNNLPITLVELQNVINGEAVIDGPNVIFTSTNAAGIPAGFEYIAQNSDGDRNTGVVNITVEEIPPLIAVEDVYDVQQAGQVLISAESLIENDTTEFEPIIVTGVQNPIGGEVNYDGTNITFTSTGIFGDPAGFEYIAQDDIGNEAIGQVIVNITQLPGIEAYIYDTIEEALSHQDSFEPPTSSQIYNSWARFSNETFFASDQTPTGEAAAWQYNNTFNRVETTANTASCVGFVSPNSYDNFVLDTTLSSTDSDDDFIGVIIAFKRINNVNQRLIAIRHSGDPSDWGAGFPNWAIVLNLGGTHGGAQTTGTVIANGAKTILNPPAASWSNSGSTKVRVVRNSNIIRCYCSAFGSSSLEPTSEIEINLNNFPTLAWALDPCSYGFAAMSQPAATFTNINITGVLDQTRVYSIEGNKSYEYNEIDGWVELSNTTIADELEYPRQVVNPVTKSVYQINYDKSITKVN